MAFFSTGDELRSLGETLDTGCVYDSNRYTLFGMLTRLGCEVVDMGIVRDDPAALEAALRAACRDADAIVTSGGVSEGAADYTRDIMALLGDVAFWKLAMRPGRPLAFGQVRSGDDAAWLFGLPGNPVAVMVSFYMFARPALLRMMGVAEALAAPRTVRARATEAIRKRPGRTEYQRGVVATGADGEARVRLTGAQGSGILSSMTGANCIVVLGHGQANVAAGDMVDICLLYTSPSPRDATLIRPTCFRVWTLSLANSGDTLFPGMDAFVCKFWRHVGRIRRNAVIRHL